MRATAVYVKRPMVTKKRKAQDYVQVQKKIFLDKSLSERDKSETEKIEKSNGSADIISPFTPLPLNSTKNYLQVLVNTLKASAKRILPASLYNVVTASSQCSKTMKVETKELHKEFVKAKKMLFNSSKYRNPISIDSVMSGLSPTKFSPILLETKLKIYQNESIYDTLGDVPNKQSHLSIILKDYLKTRKSTLFRSTTGNNLSKHAIVSSVDVEKFSCLVEDPIISLFIKRDICRRYADKYLLSMVFAYFVRAQLDHINYTRDNFFAALYLAHDMEEEDEDLKYEVFPYCLGPNWRKCYPYLLSIRDDLFWAVNCRAVVSRKCCEQIMCLMPNHWMWQRERPEYHTTIIRDKDPNEGYPRGPNGSPICCRTCLERECLDSENSYIVYSSLSDDSNSSDESSETDPPETSSNAKKDSGFESFLFDANETNDDDKENQDPNEKLK